MTRDERILSVLNALLSSNDPDNYENGTRDLVNIAVSTVDYLDLQTAKPAGTVQADSADDEDEEEEEVVNVTETNGNTKKRNLFGF